MGLGSVDFILEVEEEFGVVIPPEEVPRLMRLGDFRDFLVETLNLRGEMPDKDEVWNRLVRIVQQHTGARDHKVTPDAHLHYDLGLD